MKVKLLQEIGIHSDGAIIDIEDSNGDGLRRSQLCRFINRTLGDVSLATTWAPVKGASLEEKIFAINVDYYENKDDYYVFSLTDITKLKEKSNLLEYQASHDKLTGLFNRNRFDELYEKEIKRARRYNNDLSLILFDIDNFKMINDSYGHQTGDEVLKEIAKIILGNVREQDINVRWGGEEFLILLPQTNLLGAFTVANKIRTSIETNIFTTNSLNITASFGVTQLLENDDESSFITRSDKFLYEAKKTGKNKVVSS